jgi:hypothetical protein
MYKTPVTTLVQGLFNEVVFGSPDPAKPTYLLNRGDPGLLASLENIVADDASSTVNGGGSIAAHADHLRYGFSLLNRWAAGEAEPWKTADWTVSWKKTRVGEPEWRSLRDDLRREAEAWRDTLGQERELSESAASWMIATLPHTAYHLGAIRQIDRAARGPSAEDEKKQHERERARQNG